MNFWSFFIFSPMLGLKLISLFSLLIGFGVTNPTKAEVGFSTGDEFFTRTRVGPLTLVCPRETRVVYCSDHILFPKNHDYLTFPQNINAEIVKVSRVNNRGQVRTKSSRIFGSSGRSAKTFNLWVKTLFQKPLLAMGVNTLTYEFINDGNTVKQGEFTVVVNEGENQYCEHIIMSGILGDCMNPHALCGVYFTRTSCK